MWFGLMSTSKEGKYMREGLQHGCCERIHSAHSVEKKRFLNITKRGLTYLNVSNKNTFATV
jgi:hypothetical protein